MTELYDFIEKYGVYIYISIIFVVTALIGMDLVDVIRAYRARRDG